MIEDLWNDLVAALFGALFEIKQELWDTVSGMYYEWLYSYFSDSAGPLSDAFTALVMASYVGVVVTAGLIILFHETLQTKYTLREMLPRLVIAILLVGLAREITWQVFSISRLLADAFTLTDRVGSVTCDNFPDGSATPIDPAECEGYEHVMRSEFANEAFMVATGPDAADPVGLVDVGMQLVSIWIYVLLIVIFLMRNIAWFCVLIMAPLALACHSLPQLERFAYYWWRLLGACLVSSLGQCALIWIYHQLDGTIQFGDDSEVKYVDDYSLLLFYLVLIAWLMWKLHKIAFQLARGTHVKVPGSKFFAFLLMNRLMNSRSRNNHWGRSRRKRSNPRSADDDDTTSGGTRQMQKRPIRHSPTNSGQRDSSVSQRKANGSHDAYDGAPGGPAADDTSTSADPVPARIDHSASTPREVADRTEEHEQPKGPERFGQWEHFRRQSDAFHAHRQELARRTQRDAGARRKQERRADAVDERVDVPRHLRHHEAVAEPARKESPRQAAGWIGQTAMPHAHRGEPDWILTILPEHRGEPSPGRRPAPDSETDRTEGDQS